MADTYTQLIGRLKLVTSGSLNLTQAYDALFASAQKNYSSVEGTVQLYSRFAKATNTLGVTQRDVVEVADSVNKAIAIFGGNAQQDGEHAKMMAREMRVQVDEIGNVALIKQSCGGGLLRRL